MDGNNKFDLASAFAAVAKSKAEYFQAEDPLYLKLGKTHHGSDMKFAKSYNARMQLATFVDGNYVQVAPV